MYKTKRFFRKIGFWTLFWIKLPSDFVLYLKSDEWKKELAEINRKSAEKWTPERKKMWRQAIVFGFIVGTANTIYLVWLYIEIFIK